MEDKTRSIERAIAIIRIVAASGAEGCRLSEIAPRADLHKASAARALNTLVMSEVLERGSDRRFRVAQAFHEALGMPVSSARLREKAQPSLSDVVTTLGDVTLLSVRSGYESLCIDRHIGTYALQALSLDVGVRRPLGVGAGSLALIAWLPDGEIEAILEKVVPKLPAYPAMSAAAVLDFVAAAREQGFSYLPNVVVSGMTGMGVPVRDMTGQVVAALSVGAVGDRLDGARKKLAADALGQARDRLEGRLGRTVEGDDR